MNLSIQFGFHCRGALRHAPRHGKANPALKIATISTISQEDISKLDKENLGKADFIICVDEDMTTTY